ncbi:MAG: Gfo/Idh/MocA family protein [Acidimicrobiales bacterium]
MRIVIVSCRLTDRRRAALTGLVATEGTPVFLDIDEIENLLADDRPGAVVLDGPLGPPSAALAGQLQGWVARGTAVLALSPAAGAGPSGRWAELLCATAQPPMPAGEVFARVTDADEPLVARVDAEFPLVDVFQPLSPVTDGVRPVLSVTYRFVNQTALLVAERGEGRVVVSGLGATEQALVAPALAAILRRALRTGVATASARRPPLGVGVVGYGPYGGMGFVHGTAVTAVAGLDLVATCDSDAGRRKAAEQDFPGIRVHDTVEELAADDEVDVAVVATPPSAHVRVVSTLLAAAKHVACEKPLCFTVADADGLFALAADNDRVLTVNQSRRWDRDFRAVQRTVDGGQLGEVFNVETFVGGFDHPCRAWHSDSTVSGGMVYDWGAHHIDWILQLFGSVPARVTATGHKRVWHDVTNLDQLRVRMHWDDGREAEFVASDVAAVRRPKFYVQGTAGTLVGRYQELGFEHVDPARGYVRTDAHHAEAPAALTLAGYSSGSGVSESVVALAPEMPFAFHRNLADHLLLGEPLAVVAQSAREVIAVLEAATRSAAEGGQPVDLR